jgi:hypothetical protein
MMVSLELLVLMVLIVGIQIPTESMIQKKTLMVMMFGIPKIALCKHR